jgi:hypothetical protein
MTNMTNIFGVLKDQVWRGKLIGLRLFVTAVLSPWEGPLFGSYEF